MTNDLSRFSQLSNPKSWSYFSFAIPINLPDFNLYKEKPSGTEWKGKVLFMIKANDISRKPRKETYFQWGPMMCAYREMGNEGRSPF